PRRLLLGPGIDCERCDECNPRDDLFTGFTTDLARYVPRVGVGEFDARHVSTALDAHAHAQCTRDLVWLGEARAPSPLLDLIEKGGVVRTLGRRLVLEE